MVNTRSLQIRSVALRRTVEPDLRNRSNLMSVGPDAMTRSNNLDPKQHKVIKVRSLRIDRTSPRNTWLTTLLANSSQSIRSSWLRSGADITLTSTSSPKPKFLKLLSNFKSLTMQPTTGTKSKSMSASKP